MLPSLLLLFVIVTRCTSDLKRDSICKECFKFGRICHIYVRQLEQGAFGNISACHYESEEEEIKLSYYDDGYYQCADNNNVILYI